jgi:hypothetical protein
MSGVGPGVTGIVATGAACRNRFDTLGARVGSEEQADTTNAKRDNIRIIAVFLETGTGRFIKILSQ